MSPAEDALLLLAIVRRHLRSLRIGLDPDFPEEDWGFTAQQALEKLLKAWIVLADGRELIDGIASWWTACHGYNHPYIAAAVEKQLADMPHVMFGGLVHEQPLWLAQRLASLLPGDLQRAFFSESGSVAVEIALKMSFHFWRNSGQPSKQKFISLDNSYHGETLGALSVTVEPVLDPTATRVATHTTEPDATRVA